MTKKQMTELLRQGIESRQLCRCFFRYEENYRYYFPLKVNEKFFLGAEEDDFILDGYSIRRIRDLKKVQYKDDKCIEILRSEGIVDTIRVPEVDITDWHHIFTSLQSLGCNIIIENESLDTKCSDFAIGKIKKVLGRSVRFHPFDANGIWYDYDLDIPFSQITSVTFASRYVDVFSKYLDPETY